MDLLEEGCVLRFFMNESDRHEGKPLYEWLLLKAQENGLAGATVFRGMMGFGAHGRIHSFKIERLAQDMPIVIELVDVQAKIESFLAILGNQIESGLVTLHKASVCFRRSE